MEIGGRQGSRLTGRLFSKMMDTLAEELIAAKDGVELSDEFKIPALLWVDDVLSCANGEMEQMAMLNKIDDFAVRHKLQWGTHKCNVMRVGYHNNQTQKEWMLGQMPIQEATTYRYLGDVITYKQ